MFKQLFLTTSIMLGLTTTTASMVHADPAPTIKHTTSSYCDVYAKHRTPSNDYFEAVCLEGVDNSKNFTTNNMRHVLHRLRAEGYTRFGDTKLSEEEGNIRLLDSQGVHRLSDVVPASVKAGKDFVNTQHTYMVLPLTWWINVVNPYDQGLNNGFNEQITPITKFMNMELFDIVHHPSHILQSPDSFTAYCVSFINDNLAKK